LTKYIQQRLLNSVHPTLIQIQRAGLKKIKTKSPVEVYFLSYNKNLDLTYIVI